MTTDLFIIGGGVNGCGIARDAAGRGLSVTLAEMNDLASGTSSASTKLFHGGLRYLEYFEFSLVREALIERERLLAAMPHISWPMRFILPLCSEMRFEARTPASQLIHFFMPWLDARRPAWLIRLGLFIYDHLGGRHILPPTSTVDLKTAPEGRILKKSFATAYEYSDCWVDDARLVVLNARDAEQRGARILTRMQVVSARVEDGLWHVDVRDRESGRTETHQSRLLVNAGGPWAGDILHAQMGRNRGHDTRLVRGSHIVTRRLYAHTKSYFLQGADGRIIFIIPYETDFTLIGTTEIEHDDMGVSPHCTAGERSYLLNFANQYLEKPLSEEDIVWSFAGVRPLSDDGAQTAAATSREYTLDLDRDSGAPFLNISGGKITTYRRLSEIAVNQICTELRRPDKAWTAGVALPGGDFPLQAVDDQIMALQVKYPFLDSAWAGRLVRAYGTLSRDVLGAAQTASDLGIDFGARLTEQEVRWLMQHEYARSTDDVLWRRSKLGLRLSKPEVDILAAWMQVERERQA